jgi:D-alanine-D-alanine ligase
VDQSIQDTIRKEAVRAFKAIDGHGLARCDFFLDKDTGDLYLNELNTLPGFTNISMYPQLMEDFGISQEELINRLIALALER